MFKYSTKKKRLYYDKVIHLYVDEHLSPARIAKILPLGETTTSRWIRDFVAENPQYRRGNTAKYKKSLYYDKVIHLYVDEHLGKRRIARILPLGENTISTWIRNFVAENPQYRNCNMAKKGTKSSGKGYVPAGKASKEVERGGVSLQDYESVCKELREMRRKLEDAEMKAAIYDEMINVAEDMFKIPIRKKAGTK